MPRRRIAKAAVCDLIVAAYPHGYGPRAVAKMVGYSYKTVQEYATALGVKVGTTRPRPPDEPPIDVLHVLAAHNIAGNR